MNCKKCGFSLKEEDKSCSNCGALVESNVNDTLEEEILGEESGDTNTSLLNKTLMSSVNDTYDKISSIGENDTKKGEKIGTITSLKNNINGSSLYVNNNVSKNVGAGNNKRKSNNKLLIIGFVMVILVIVYLLVLLLVPKIMNCNNQDVNNSKNNQENIVTSKNTVSVSAEGYTFDMVTDLVYEIESDRISITSLNKSWVSSVEVFPMSYDEVLNTKEQIKQEFIKKGFTNVSYNEKNIGDVKYLIFELSGKNENVIVAINKADITETFMTVLKNNDNTFDTIGLEKIGSVLKTAKKQSFSIDDQSDSNDLDYAEIIEEVMG